MLQQREERMAILDMYGNVNDLMQMYQQMKSNPMQLLSRRFNIPQDLNNPNDIIQHLLNTGQVSQAQVNNAMRFRQNPIIQQLMRH